MNVEKTSEDRKFEENKKYVMGFASLVYVGVVIAASTIFISFVLTAFPKDAYFSRVVMVLAGLLIGFSMIAFPLALHMWAIRGAHRTVTTVLYYIEMLIIAINTFVSFTSLLAKYTGYNPPDWAILYEPFSVASIVYTLAAWGTVFLLDPSAKRRAQSIQFTENFEDKVAKLRDSFLDTVEGEQAIADAATKDIQHILAKARNEKQHFGTARAQAVSYQSTAQQPEQDFRPAPHKEPAGSNGNGHYPT